MMLGHNIFGEGFIGILTRPGYPVVEGIIDAQPAGNRHIMTDGELRPIGELEMVFHPIGLLERLQGRQDRLFHIIHFVV